jgi:PAS domain S-box-containing protein
LAEDRVEDARRLILGIQEERHQRIDVILNELETREDIQGSRLVGESAQRSRLYNWTFLGAAIVAVAGAGFLALLLHRLVAEFLAEQDRAQSELHRLNRTLRVLSAGNQALVRAATEPELLQVICQLIVNEGGYHMAWVGMAQSDEARTVLPVAQAGFEAGYLETAEISWGDNERGRGPTGTAIRQGEPIASRNMLTDQTITPWRADAVRHGYASSLALPLLDGRTAFGALSVYAKEPDAFDARERELLGELATDLAYGILSLRARAEHARTEQSLQRSEQSLQEAQRLAHLGNWELDLVSNTLRWSAEIYRIFEIDPTSFGASYEAFLNAIHPEDRARVDREYNESVKNRTSYELVHRLLLPGGRVKHVLERGETVYDESDRALRSIGTVQDITDRILAENELRRRNSALQLVNRIVAITSTEEEPGGMLAKSCQELARAFDVPAAIALLQDDGGASRSYAAGPDAMLEPLPPLPSDGLRDWFDRLDQEKGAIGITDAGHDLRAGLLRGTCAERGLKSLLLCPVRAQGQGRCALVLGDDKTRTFQPEDLALMETVAGEIASALSRSRLHEIGRRLTTAIEQSPESVVVTDPTARIVYVNPAFEKLTGYARADALGQNPRILKSGQQDEAFYREMWTQLTAGRVWHGRLVNKRKDGSLFTEDAIIAPVHDGAGAIVNYVATKRDISRELQLEAQFLQAQKMEAFGQLAGGVAHDFNNILAVIMMHLNLMQLDPGLSPKLRTDLKDLENDAQRAANLTRQLLMFSRRHVMQQQPLDLNQVLNGLFKMLRRILGENINFVFQGGEQTIPIEADTGMIEQVVMNLCVNARDAMPQGGTLTIETKLADLDGHYVHGSPRTGHYAILSVADTGCGMDPTTLKRLFEPFFTTKAAGKGTGLGLATVQGIVDQHHGWVEVESVLQQGSTFRVYLPAMTLPMIADTKAEAAPVIGGTESILVVEDEAPVRQLIAKCLLHHGYQVVTASNGQEALRKWEEQDHQFDLLLTDMIMPEGMTGIDVAEQLTRAKDTLKVVICSGYSAKVKESQSPVAKSALYLPKPFDINILLNVVRQALDRK